MAKFCTNCGKELKEGAQVCLECGAMVDEAVAKKATKNTTDSSVKPKSKVAAGILGIFLGYLGIHNFYLGFTGKAVAQLLITTVGTIVIGTISCGMLAPVPILATSVWGLIEGILILTGSINADADGVPLEN